MRIESYRRPSTIDVGLAPVFRGPFIVPLFAKRRSVMTKYLLGWLLGVPVVVLVIIYLFMH